MYNLNGYIQALKDEEAGVEGAPAALALGQIGKPAVAELIKALYNENHVVLHGRCKGFGTDVKQALGDALIYNLTVTSASR